MYLSGGNESIFANVDSHAPSLSREIFHYALSKSRIFSHFTSESKFGMTVNAGLQVHVDVSIC